MESIQTGHVKTDPILRLKSSEVDLNELSSERIKNILLVLRGVMKRYKAVGISAPQIGIPLRIIMIEIPDSLIEQFGPETCKTREIVPTPFKVGSLGKKIFTMILTIVYRFLLTH